MILSLIHKKRHGGRLTGAEIEAFVRGVTERTVPDYQTAALLMAVCFVGLDEEETLSLALHMARSGLTLDLSSLPGIKADKHSTGGIGDKTTLVIAPLAAACGLTVAKLAGRGLGFTGGTIDKLESIPGFNTDVDTEAFYDILRKTGVCVAAQSERLTPADRVLYELRDVTGTVDSIPLIAASVMSKKIATGADCVLLDVKCGSGAFMKSGGEAQMLADTMTAIGRGAGLTCEARVSPMNEPLGSAVGNALEVYEALDVLRGKGPADLTECCLALTETLLSLAERRKNPLCKTGHEAFRAQALEKVSDGSAYRKFCEMVAAQGGDVSALEGGLPSAPFVRELKADRSGYVTITDAQAIGFAAGALGAGRRRKGDAADPAAGIVFRKKTGASVSPGEPICEMHTSNEAFFPGAECLLRGAINIQ